MSVSVLGSGTMGAGIAQLAAMNGFEAIMYDVSDDMLERARDAVESSLARFSKKGALSEEEASAVRGRLSATTDLERCVSAAGYIIEAVPEDLAIKRRVLSEAAGLAPSDAVLGTNTSQLSITAIGAALGGAAGRLVGTHFFNPPVLMKLVELIRGEATTDDTFERARSFAKDLGKEVVVLHRDSPGFITTRISAIVRLECLRILEEGVASAEDIDKACRLGLGYPMGPLELGDFNGLDTYLKALEYLEAEYGDRFKATPALEALVAEGRLGRKTGAGFYEYDEAGRRVPSEMARVDG